MATEIITYKTEQEWLDLRKHDITSTDVAALFGLSPYKTEFELYHEKKSGEQPAFKDNERMRWGRRLEAAIAEGIAEDMGWKIEPLKVYMRDPKIRIGSSFDFKIEDDDHGEGTMEIKNVDALVYRRNWKDEGGQPIEAPAHIELQVQHQMLVNGYKWSAICAMVGGNTAKVIFRRANPKIFDRIVDKVSGFWERVDKGNPPSADYSRDADMILKINSMANDGEVFDARDDANIARLVAQHQQVKKEISDRERLIKSYQAQIIERIGQAAKVIIENGSISTSMTAGNPGKLITADMIGQRIGERSGFRNFRIYTKEKA